MSHRVCVLALLVGGLVGCQSKAEPDPPRPPRPVIEARSWGAAVARITNGHPCRAEIEGEEMLIGTEPLVMQIGNSRWSGETTDAGTTLHKDGHALVRVRPIHDAGIEVFDARGAAILQVAGDGVIANARGDVLRRAEAQPAAIKIGDSMVTGTSDVALAVLITAPELVPEVRGLAACQRLFAKEQAARK